ncbi:MAG: purine-nucleoside phosphorylase [Bacilli bacterium]|nr:purine-nucleoside phosphorylase [Bacilli bacterium]MDD4407362.1 purine-nucleoside phosphorylase [Bacilli bacterium]
MKPIHIVTEKENIANIVLLPGDPLRAKYIAEKYLDNAMLINEVRNMLGYTGTYKGKKITVIGSGMGIPSVGIYAYELYKFYNVNKIIRIGSAGAFTKDVKITDIVLGKNAYSYSNFAYAIKKSNEKLIKSSNSLNEKILNKSKELNIPIHFGTIYTSEVFDVYHNIDHLKDNIPEGIKPIASEMEAFGLFHIADLLNEEASCLVTISDSRFEENKDLTSEERQYTLDKMIILALESITS